MRSAQAAFRICVIVLLLFSVRSAHAVLDDNVVQGQVREAEKEARDRAERPVLPADVMPLVGCFATACFLVMAAQTVMTRISLARKQGMGSWELAQQDLAHLPVTLPCPRDVRQAHGVKLTATIAGGIGIAISSLNGAAYMAGLYGAANAPWAFLPANPVVLAFLAWVCYRTGGRAEQAIRRLTITPDDVTLVTPRRHGEERWTEALASYRLLGKTAVHSQSRRRENDEYHLEMSLLHPSPDRSLLVYRRKGSLDTVPKNETVTGRRLCKTYAGLLGVGAIEEHDGHRIEHEAEDVGKFARDLVREGKLDAPLDSDGPVPKGITVRAENGETIVTINPGRDLEVKIMRGLGIVLGLVMSMSFVVGGKDAWAVVYALAGGAMIVWAVWYRQPQGRLRITRDNVRVQSVTPRRETTLRTLDALRIEDVRLETRDDAQRALGQIWSKMNKDSDRPLPLRKGAHLSLVTDTGRTPLFRERLPLETAEWLRSFILRIIAADQPPQPADHSEATL